MLILKRKPSHLFLPRPSSTSPTADNTHLVFSFSTVADQISPPKTLFVTKYLIDTIGLSPDKAIKASKSIAHVKSSSNPDAVLGFLKHSGWSDADIRNVVTKRPDLLCTKVEETLKPKLEALGGLGLSQSEQISLASRNPNVLRITDLQPKIAFLKTVFGTNEKLLKAITRRYYLLTCSLGERIIPNLEILRECGISNAQIANFMLNNQRFFTNRADYIKASIKRVEDLGVPRHTGMFGATLRSIICVSKTTFNTKVRLLKSLGWSETEVFTSFRKMPPLLNLSVEMIRSKVEFYTKDVGWDISDIANSPVYLTYSMERRLVPRHCVLKKLKQEKLITGGKSAFGMNEKMFINKFILPYKDRIPLLHETYSAAIGNAPKRMTRSNEE